MCRGLHCSGCRSTGGSGGGVLVALAGIVAVAALGYRTADAALTGVAASTAAVNEALAWALAAIGVVAAVTAGGWVLLARRRRVQDAPVEADFRSRVDAALVAREKARELMVAPGSAERRSLGRSTAPLRVEAVRRDRLGPGSTR